MIDIDAKATLIETHMDRCTRAMTALRIALANWHMPVVLERPSEPQRWESVVHAHCTLRAALADLHRDFPDMSDEDEAPDTERTPLEIAFTAGFAPAPATRDCPPAIGAEITERAAPVLGTVVEVGSVIKLEVGFEPAREPQVCWNHGGAGRVEHCYKCAAGT
jgi:hypothetical protein